jgi:hypothetical protein
MRSLLATAVCLKMASTACHVAVRFDATTPLGRSCIAECRTKSATWTGYKRLGQHSQPDPIGDCVKGCPGVSASDGECTPRATAQNLCFQSERVSAWRTLGAVAGVTVGTIALLFLGLVASCSDGNSEGCPS